MDRNSMKKLLFGASLLLVASAAFGQSNLTNRVFTYDATTAVNGLSTFEVDNTTEYDNGGTAGTSTSNSVTSATTSGATFAVNTTINVLTYVYLNGNFGGTYTVHGPGTTTDVNHNNDLEVRTNRPLTFTTSGFTVLQTGGSGASSAGSIAYAVSLWSDYPASATQVGATQTGTDTGINGKTLTSTMANIATDGKLTLRVGRTLTLTQLAMGATTYTASGTIALAIN